MSKPSEDLLEKYNKVWREASKQSDGDYIDKSRVGWTLFVDTLLLALEQRELDIASKLLSMKSDNGKPMFEMKKSVRTFKKCCQIVVNAIENRDEGIIRLVCEHIWKDGLSPGGFEYRSMDIYDFQAFLITRAIVMDLSPSTKALIIQTMSKNQPVDWNRFGQMMMDTMTVQGLDVQVQRDLKKLEEQENSESAREDYSREVGEFCERSKCPPVKALSAHLLRDIAIGSNKNVDKAIVAMIRARCDQFPAISLNSLVDFTNKGIHACFFESLEDERGAEVACAIAKDMWEGSIDNMEYLPITKGWNWFDSIVLARVMYHQNFSTLCFFWYMNDRDDYVDWNRLGSNIAKVVSLAEERRKYDKKASDLHKGPN